MSTEKVDGGIGGSGGERDQLIETLFEKALFVGLMPATIIGFLPLAVQLCGHLELPLQMAALSAQTSPSASSLGLKLMFVLLLENWAAEHRQARQNG
jgi:hypothetical protein